MRRQDEICFSRETLPLSRVTQIGSMGMKEKTNFLNSVANLFAAFPILDTRRDSWKISHLL